VLLKRAKTAPIADANGKRRQAADVIRHFA